MVKSADDLRPFVSPGDASAGKGGALQLSEITTAPLSVQVREVLKGRISRGELAPGERIVELHTARELNVSQSTVREALKGLAHEGLVLQTARRGTYVARVDKAQAQHAYRVRAALESLAASEASEHIDESRLQQLESDLEAMRSSAKAGDLASFVESDIAFHRHVWEASENPFLPQIWNQLELTVRNLTRISNPIFFRNLDEIAATHEPLLQALRSRDASRASILFSEHVTSVWHRIAMPEAFGSSRQ